MTTIQDLSNEIILSILENETISLSDVENFSFTCKGFEWISHYETLWKKKYAQKWPTAKQFCKDTMGIEFNDLNIEDFREGMKCAENLWLYVPRISQMYYYCNTFYFNLIHKDDLHTEKHPLNLLILRDELMKNISSRSTTKEDTLHYRQALWCAIYICVANRLGLHVLTTMHGIENNYALHSNIHLVWQSGKYIENRECFTFEWTDNTDNAKISHIKKCQVPPRFISLFSDRNLHLLGLPRSVADNTIRDIYFLWVRGCFPFDDLSYRAKSIIYYDEKICTPDKTFRKKRSPNLKYAIGLIVTHKHKMEDNTQKDVAGVIIGWHNECHIERFKYISTYCSSSYDVTEKCIQKNNIDNWKSQPHYVLLIEKDLCYVPQYAITSVCKKWINNNPEVGKYFCKFEDTHYVPNNMLGQHYPDDAAVVRDILLNNLKL
ncbi:uncharacterized protein LOC114944600 isoform X1 [Nylanderia fulva]|uniref:uncharacterized protein LOC114944600 isoform X1 n=1 Tax=Nylanderia fulva TaxID=613905 RepID=UPI0010FAE620|nr:uncharacterized protein LOC114944600 isoform X1 [Nylanderia fulva]